MKTVKLFLCAVVGALMLSSCSLPLSTGTPLYGVAYTGVKSPITATGNANANKVGTSKATCILGIAAWGDAGIEKASRQAGITKIHHVDQKFTNILGVFSSYKVYVYGE